VRVDRHRDAIVPSLKAGKDVFVEWPLGKSLADAEEILSHKKEGTRAYVGLQARYAPIIATIKDFISSGKLGDVLSSTWQGYNEITPGPSVGADFQYIADKKIGGNFVTILTGHAIDYVQQGEFSSAPRPIDYLRRDNYTYMIIFNMVY
jgi:predicted dehydrogenase